ncbi:hypothetical protein [Pseudonocardia sp. GCM10023141]|uniref:hypothetical protein n=1 Tax=Pseudonocardia sp. GCM10023141 TaxID=3252653 RepID=UPI00360809A3
MTRLVPVPTVRSAAFGDLFDAVEALMIRDQAPPDTERRQAWSADAERITGEIVRHLSLARAPLSSSFVPTPAA